LAFDQILVTSYPTIINDARGLALPRSTSTLPFHWFFLGHGDMALLLFAPWIISGS
jgi:hypothetical protein